VLGLGLRLGCVSCLPRCHSSPSATALSSHVIALRSSSDMPLPYLVMARLGVSVRLKGRGTGYGVSLDALSGLG